MCRHAFGQFIVAKMSIEFCHFYVKTCGHLCFLFMISGDIEPGTISAPRYQSDVTSIRFSWTDFEADMEIMNYYAGVSSQLPDFDNETHPCHFYMEDNADAFDVAQIQVPTLVICG